MSNPRLSGNTMEAAASSASPDCVKLALELGSDPGVVGNYSNPLSYAIGDEPEDLAVTRLLLENGADPNLPDRNGSLPLAAAVGRRSTEAARLMLQWGALPDKMDSAGRAPRDWAVKENKLAMVALFDEFAARRSIRRLGAG